MNHKEFSCGTLALAIGAALAGSLLSSSAHAAQLIVTDGTTQTASGAYDTGTAYGGTVSSSGTALGAEGTNSIIQGSGVTATTGGPSANAVIANRGGRVSLSDSTLSSSSGLTVVSGNQGLVELSGSRVDGWGVKAEYGGAVTLRNGTTVAAGSNNALLSDGSGSLIDVDDATVSGRAGATAKGGRINIANSQIQGAYVGIHADYAGEVHLDQTSVASNGRGIEVHGATLVATDSKIKAGGLEQGVEVSIGGTLELARTTVEAAGNALSMGTGVKITGRTTLNRATVSGGSLASSGHAAVLAMADTNELHLRDGVKLSGGNNELIYVGINPEPITLSVTTDQVDLVGDLRASSGSLNLALANRSTLTGKITNGDAVSLDSSSAWTVTGYSDVNSLTSAGAIAFATPIGRGFKSITVDGDYASSGGTLTLNTELGDDNSQTDRLVVKGATSGDTAVTVNNVGGAGAQTVNGIQVVRVDGASNGTFALNGRAVGGAYEYLLHKGGVVDPNDGDWYLRSQATTVPVPTPDPQPVPTPGPQPTPAPSPQPAPNADPTAVPLYRPETGAYLANQAAAVGMFQHVMHDRMGEPTFAHGGDDRAAAGWVRVVRNQMDGQAGFDQLNVGTDTSVVQLGGEMALWTGDSRFHLGLMGGTGRADTHVDSNARGVDARAKGKVKGYNLGMYGTWFATASAPAGLYVDGWLQYGRYDHSVLGDYLDEERYDATSWAASLEAGYAFALSQGGKTDLYIEPQVQAIFTDYSAQTHRERNGTVVEDIQAGGLTSRLGVRFYGHASSDAGNLVQPFVSVNWWHDSDKNVMAFDGTTLILDLPRDRYELKLGAQAQLGGGWTGWGQLGLQAGADGYRDVGGQVGVNYRW
ncbi:autotransporter outer membrane beta-barrel domain-containing protein [Lysobacter sp. FW306-1B-D06B]|uniref:autotransporter family protein n=1 Tax=Lysobacter sp. FW306-1B-D06B TaxID=3140250 RepID=UPI003140B520